MPTSAETRRSCDHWLGSRRNSVTSFANTQPGGPGSGRTRSASQRESGRSAAPARTWPVWARDQAMRKTRSTTAALVRKSIAAVLASMPK